MIEGDKKKKVFIKKRKIWEKGTPLRGDSERLDCS